MKAEQELALGFTEMLRLLQRMDVNLEKMAKAWEIFLMRQLQEELKEK